MISKKLYWAKWMENVKRRGWTFALCGVVMFLLYPVYNIISLSSMKNNLAELAANGLSAAELASEESYIRTVFAADIGFSDIFVLAAAFFAVLFAVQGFSFLYSRQKMDLYMSVPVSAPKRFVLLWANGVICFGAAVLTGLLLCWGIGAAYGVLDAVMLVQSFMAFLVNMLAFIALYNLSLLAVMLTGNMLTALLGCSVLFFYEFVIRQIFSTLKTMFFYSYCGVDDSRLMALPWLTPFTGYFRFCQQVWYRSGSLYGYYGESRFSRALLTEVCLLAFAAAVSGLLVYRLFRRRRTESYHHAVAFGILKPVLEIFLLTPFSIAVGLLISRTAFDTGIFLFAGAAGGALIGHALIQLIYERDLKALVRRRGLLAFCMLASLLTLCVFRFDLTGFDRFLPQNEDVKSVAVSLETDYSNFGRYGTPFLAGDRTFAVDDILKNMNSAQPETIDAVLSMAAKWRDAGMPGADYDSGIHTAADSGEKAEMEDSRRWIVCYTLNSGRRVIRRFYAGKSAGAELETVMRDPSYKKLRYQLYEEAFEQAVSQMKIYCDDGRQEVLYTGDQEKLLEAFRSDFESYGYRLLTEKLPCARLRFLLKAPEGTSYSDMEWNYPIYGNFEKSIAVLAQNGIDAGEKESFLTAEDVSGITVRYYHYGGREDSLFASGEIQEQEIVYTFDEPEEISALLPALYPESLSRTAGEEVRYLDRDSRFSVSITLTPEAVKKRWSVPEMFFLKGQEPEFLAKKIKEAAAYG